MAPPLKPIDLPENKTLELSEIVNYTIQNNAINYQNRVQLEMLQKWILVIDSTFNPK